MPIYDDLRNSKKRHIIFKKFLLFFFKFNNFNPAPRKQLIKIILNLLSPSAALN